VTHWQAQVRAGVTYETSNVNSEEQPPSESDERHHDVNEHTSMYLYTVLCVLYL